MLLYERIVPLNRDRHRHLRLARSEGDAGFARATHYVPLAGTEFYTACRDYPILFAGGEQGGPIALLGLREGENLFVEDSGAWDEQRYVPAFVRRYPFVLAQGDDGEQFTVCFDEAHGGFNSEHGEALFDQQGAYTPFLERVIEFLQRFRAEMVQTDRLVSRLEELDLLVEQNLQVNTPGGRRFALQGFRVVDEARLRQLADGKVGELLREGYLGWIHAHLVSLNNLARLAPRMAEPEAQGARPDGQAASSETEPDGEAHTPPEQETKTTRKKAAARKRSARASRE